jgi:CRISPR/Cas system-associated exonuclease Cas4 (RecB family)
MLMAATRSDWQAATDILPAKRSRPVQIDSALISTMVGEAERLTIIKQKVQAPAAQPIPLCSKCSYRFLCGFT